MTSNTGSVCWYILHELRMSDNNSHSANWIPIGQKPHTKSSTIVDIVFIIIDTVFISCDIFEQVWEVVEPFVHLRVSLYSNSGNVLCVYSQIVFDRGCPGFHMESDIAIRFWTYV